MLLQIPRYPQNLATLITCSHATTDVSLPKKLYHIYHMQSEFFYATPTRRVAENKNENKDHGAPFTSHVEIKHATKGKIPPSSEELPKPQIKTSCRDKTCYYRCLPTHKTFSHLSHAAGVSC